MSSTVGAKLKRPNGSGSTYISAQKPGVVQAVSENYQEVAHFINLQIKQKRLDAATCYPWELDCDPPGLKG